MYRISDDTSIRLFSDAEPASNADSAHHNDDSIPNSIGESEPWLGNHRQRHRRRRRAFAAVIVFAPTADSCALRLIQHLIQYLFCVFIYFSLVSPHSRSDLSICLIACCIVHTFLPPFKLFPGFGANLHASELVAFVEAGGSVIVAACATASHLFGAQFHSSESSHKGGCTDSIDEHCASDHVGTIGNRIGASHDAGHRDRSAAVRHIQCTGALVTDFALRCGIAFETNCRIGGIGACESETVESGSSPQRPSPSAMTSADLVDLDNTAFLSRLLEMSWQRQASSSVNDADNRSSSVDDAALGMIIVYDGISQVLFH